MTMTEYRDYWRLCETAGLALICLRDLLAHPSLDLGDGERAEYELDCQALADSLPAKCRAVTRPTAAPTTEVIDCPF